MKKYPPALLQASFLESAMGMYPGMLKNTLPCQQCIYMRQLHELMPFHWCAKMNVFRWAHMYLAPAMEMMLLMRSLAIDVSAVRVLTSS
eukprot:8385894-Ditylum_brightwellii.AAC.1